MFLETETLSEALSRTGAYLDIGYRPYQEEKPYECLCHC